MATRPENVFLPQPQGLLARARSSLGNLLGTNAPLARPNEVNPVDTASPTAPGAPVPQGTYSRGFGGFSIDPRYLGQLALNDDTILVNEGGRDLKLYDAILDDDICASAFQQRRLAVISRPWEVDPGDDTPQAALAADHLRDQLRVVGWDRICNLMLYGRWYGYAVAEMLYEIGPDGKIWIGDVLVPDRKVFGFTNSGQLRLKTPENGEGEVLPDNKFWAFRTGGSHDFDSYGSGLAHWCYWPAWFKKNVIKFWTVYLEKFGMPTTLGKFPESASADEQGNLLAAAMAVASDRAVIVPQGMELELLEAGRASAGSYLEFVNSQNDALLRIILSQTGTSKSEAQGLGGSQSNVMKDVRDEVVRADSDMLHESFNRTVARWLTDWNFGPNVASPTVYRNLEDQEDLEAIAARDAQLKELGWERTEDSFKEVYGEGYEKVEKVVPPALAGFQGGNVERDAGGNIIDLEEERTKRASAEFSAEDLDTMDRWADQLASEADPILAEFAASLKDRLQGVTTPDQLRIALLDGLERFPADRLGELAGLPFVAARAAAQAGLEE